jgi:hypothetical protein
MSSDTDQKAAGTRPPPYDFAGHFAQIRQIADLTRNPDKQEWVSTMPSEPQHHQFVVWLGCNAIKTAVIPETLSDILTHLGVDFVPLGGPNHCCGSVHNGRGAKPVGDNMLRQTMNRFDAFTPERLLNWCPSCDSTVRKAPVEALTETVRNRQTVSTFLADVLKPDLFKHRVEMKVAVHAHVGTPDEDADDTAVGNILARIPGLEIVGRPLIDGLPRHCADVNVRKLGADNFKQAAESWFAEAKAAGASWMVSIYHSCHRQLIVAQPPNDRMEVVNYLTLVARSLGLPEREDNFSHLAKAHDVEAMMAAVTPNIEKLKLDETRARKALAKQFSKY